MPKPGHASDNKYIRPVREPVAASDLLIGNTCGMARAHVKWQPIVLQLG
jgi:hypothetical protein